MPDPALLHQLTRAGLEEQVAAAYLTGLAGGTAGLDDAALQGLVGAGLADRGADGTSVPHPPDVVLGLRARQLELQARVLRELGPQLDQLHRTTAGGHEQPIQLLRSRESLRRALRELQTGARERLRALDRGPYFATRRSSPAPDQLRAMAAGVSYQVIYAAEVVEQEDTREEVYGAVLAGEQARVLPDVPMKVVLADNDVGLVVRVTSRTRVEGYLVQPSLLLDTLSGVFETLWGLAIPIVPTRATDDPTEQERMILRGMATGLTDETIARELGISERTVARRISRLQDVLASRSRFQLGLQAARRGLL